MINAYTAELHRLTRRRTIMPATLAAVAYSVIVPGILISLVSDDPTSMMFFDKVQAAAGATRTISLAATFASVLVLALFVGMAAGDHSRGTWRAALLHNPHRLQLAAGTFLARLTLMVGLGVLVFVTGTATSFAIAPSQDIDISAWTTTEAWQTGAENLGRVLLFGAGWALIGTAIGWLTRSVPLGLAIGVLWAGPIENALGEDLEFGQRWFPGLLLRHVVTGASDYTGWQIGGTLAVYAAVVVAAVGVVTAHRDVTS